MSHARGQHAGTDVMCINLISFSNLYDLLNIVLSIDKNVQSILSGRVLGRVGAARASIEGEPR